MRPSSGWVPLSLSCSHSIDNLLCRQPTCICPCISMRHLPRGTSATILEHHFADFREYAASLERTAALHQWLGCPAAEPAESLTEGDSVEGDSHLSAISEATLRSMSFRRSASSAGARSSACRKQEAARINGSERTLLSLTTPAAAGECHSRQPSQVGHLPQGHLPQLKCHLTELSRLKTFEHAAIKVTAASRRALELDICQVTCYVGLPK